VDENGGQLGVLPIEQALGIAQERGLDLVEVAPTAQPPVVRILDYGKFKYEQSKKENEGRKKQKSSGLREVKVRPNIGRHDRDFKIRTAAKLLREGDKVKITVQFRGREITHPEIGRERIKEMIAALESDGVTVEKPVSMEGRFMNVILVEDKIRAAALAKGAVSDTPSEAPEEAKT
jgi:translation initiation factor IF-3